MEASRPDTATFSIDDLLEHMVALGASDLHVSTGSAPVIRLNGRLQRIEEFPRLTPDDTQRLLYRILSTEQQKHLEIKRQIDVSHSIPGLARFRVNVYFQRESLGAAFRMIPTELKTLEDLGLPAQLHELAKKPRGLVLVTGPTGSGKSTTLAAVIDEINRSRDDHIMTIEDPIEFLHRHKGCLVNQREIGPDATSFGEALRGALRQDPDVILLGEMRDLETISTALTAAETGHLVFATLHTQDAPSTIDRLIDVFPAAQQEQVRVQIASTLQGIVTQTLVPTVDGKGRVAACEILLPDDAVRNLIRQAKVEQIYSVMQTGSNKGMQTLEQAFVELVSRGIITQETALARSSRPDQLLGLLQRAGSTRDRPRRRGARHRRARQRAQGLLQEAQAAEAGGASRDREQPHRRPDDRGNGDRRSEAARQRGALPGAGSSTDSCRPGRARLPGVVGDGRGRSQQEARPPGGRLPRARRLVRDRVQAGRTSSRRRRPRGFRSSPGPHAAARASGRAERPRCIDDRRGAHDPRRVGRQRVRVRSRYRVGRDVPDGRAGPGARHRAGSRRDPEDAALPRRRHGSGRLDARPGRHRPRSLARCPAGFLARETLQ